MGTYRKKTPKSTKNQNKIIPNIGSMVRSRQPRFAQLSWFQVSGSGQFGQKSFVSR